MTKTPTLVEMNSLVSSKFVSNCFIHKVKKNIFLDELVHKFNAFLQFQA